jgi:2-polyprenyl-3-methyl-5-hydroxy-6-metoxy-1,4-benzoquinol methylase
MASEETTEIERARAHWHRAATYPASKEECYHGHAEAQDFDQATGKLVLEYGCGGGSDTMSYLRRGARVWYADIVHGNVDATSKRIVEAGLGNAEAYPYKLTESANLSYLASESFDIVSSHGVLHHIVDPAPVIGQFHRILKSDGHLYIMLYTEHLERRFERQIADLILAHRISKSEAFGWLTDEKGCPHARSYTADEGTDLLRDCGFRVVRTTDYAKGDFRCFKSERA